MTFSALLIFAGALAVAAGSPGPSIAALIARVFSDGTRGVLAFVAAMWIGEAIWLTCTVFGLAVLMQSFYWAFAILKYCGVAYLLYLAWKMWTAPALVADANMSKEAQSPWRLFATGLAITLGNPKIMIFYMALVPSIIDLAGITIAGWLELTVTMLIVLTLIDLSYILLAARARRLIKTPRVVRLTNRVSATVMGGAAIAIATK